MLTPDLIHKILCYEDLALEMFFEYYSDAIKKECYHFRLNKDGIPYTYFDKEKEAKLKEKIVVALKYFRG